LPDGNTLKAHIANTGQQVRDIFDRLFRKPRRKA
jgi:hypothetical protein